MTVSVRSAPADSERCAFCVCSNNVKKKYNRMSSLKTGQKHKTTSKLKNIWFAVKTVTTQPGVRAKIISCRRTVWAEIVCYLHTLKPNQHIASYPDSLKIKTCVTTCWIYSQVSLYLEGVRCRYLVWCVRKLGVTLSAELWRQTGSDAELANWKKSHYSEFWTELSSFWYLCLNCRVCEEYQNGFNSLQGAK